MVACLSFFSENHSPCRTFSEYPFKCLRQSATSMLKSVHNSPLLLSYHLSEFVTVSAFLFPSFPALLSLTPARLWVLWGQAYLHGILGMQHSTWHTVTIFAEWMDEEMGVENVVKSLISDRTGLAPWSAYSGQMILSHDLTPHWKMETVMPPRAAVLLVNWLGG